MKNVLQNLVNARAAKATRSRDAYYSLIAQASIDGELSKKEQTALDQMLLDANIRPETAITHFEAAVQYRSQLALAALEKERSRALVDAEAALRDYVSETQGEVAGRRARLAIAIRESRTGTGGIDEVNREINEYEESRVPEYDRLYIASRQAMVARDESQQAARQIAALDQQHPWLAAHIKVAA